MLCGNCHAKRIKASERCGTCHEYRRVNGTERPSSLTARQFDLNHRAHVRRSQWHRLAEILDTASP